MTSLTFAKWQALSKVLEAAIEKGFEFAGSMVKV